MSIRKRFLSILFFMYIVIVTISWACSDAFTFCDDGKGHNGLCDSHKTCKFQVDGTWTGQCIDDPTCAPPPTTTTTITTTTTVPVTTTTTTVGGGGGTTTTIISTTTTIAPTPATCIGAVNLGSIGAAGTLSGSTASLGSGGEYWAYFTTASGGDKKLTLSLTSPSGADFDAVMTLGTGATRCDSQTTKAICSDAGVSPKTCYFTPVASTTYNVKVYPYSGSGTASFSLSMDAGLPACAAPTVYSDAEIGSRCQTVKDTSFSYALKAGSADASDYEYQWCPDGKAFGDAGCGSSTSIFVSNVMSGLKAGTKYNVRVKTNTAFDATKCSAPSAWTATTSCTTTGGGGGTTTTTTTVPATTTTTTTVPATTTTTLAVDKTSPSGTVSITGTLVGGTASTTYASSQVVTLTLTCSDAGGCSKMKIVNDDFDNLASVSEQAFVTSTAWTLSTDDELKAVYVIFRDVAGNWMANNAAAADTITLDSAAPGTTIASGPSGTTTSTSATFTFSGTDDNTPLTFECQIDDGGFVSCSSPHTYSVAVGTHTFQVRAKDPAGFVDGSPASRTWTVSVAPAAVKLHDAADYTGTSCSYTADATTLGSCDNKAKSVKIPTGYVVNLYDKNNFDDGNGCLALKESVNNLLGMGNPTLYLAASSLKIYSSFSGIILYNGANRNTDDASVYFPDSRSDIRIQNTQDGCIHGDFIDLLDSGLSSFEMTSGYGVTLYENPDFKNGCRTFFQSSVDDLQPFSFNDNTRSFKLWKSEFNGAILYDKASLNKDGNNEYYPADGVKYNLQTTDCVYQKAGSIDVSNDNLALLYESSLDGITTSHVYTQFETAVGKDDADKAKNILVCPKTSTNCLSTTEDVAGPLAEFKDTPTFTTALGTNYIFKSATTTTGSSLPIDVMAYDNLWVSKCDMVVKNMGTGVSSTVPMGVSRFSVSATAQYFDVAKTQTFSTPGEYEMRVLCKDLAGRSGAPKESISGTERYLKASVCGTEANPKLLGSIGIGQSKSGTTCQMNSGAAEDWFSVATTASGKISVALDGPGTCDWNYQLFDAGGTVKLQDVTTSCDSSGTTGTALSSGTYKVKVPRISGNGAGTVTIGLGDLPKECEPEPIWTKQQIVDAYKLKFGKESCPGGIVPKCFSNKLECADSCAVNSDCAPLDNRNTCCTADSSLGADKLSPIQGQCVIKNSKMASDKWICDPGTWMGCSKSNAGQIINSAGEKFRCSYDNGGYSWEKYTENNDVVNNVLSAFTKAMGILLNGIVPRIR